MCFHGYCFAITPGIISCSVTQALVCSKVGYLVFWVLIFSVLWNGYVNSSISRSSFRLWVKEKESPSVLALPFALFLFVPGRTRLNWYGSEQKGRFCKDSVSDFSCYSVAMIIVILLLILLSYLEFSVTKVDYIDGFLNQPCIPRKNPAWLCYRILFMQFFSSLLIFIRKFTHICSWS